MDTCASCLQPFDGPLPICSGPFCGARICRQYGQRADGRCLECVAAEQACGWHAAALERLVAEGDKLTPYANRPQDDPCDPTDPCDADGFHACYRHSVGPFSPWDAPFRCGRCERQVPSRFRCVDAERGPICMDCFEDAWRA